MTNRAVSHGMKGFDRRFALWGTDMLRCKKAVFEASDYCPAETLSESEKACIVILIVSRADPSTSS